MSTSNHRRMGPSASNFRRDPPPRPAQRTHKFVTGCTYKAKWKPNQTRIRVAKHLNDCLLPRLDEVIKFKDPAGNIHHIEVNIHDDRQWFEDGLLQMMQFYNLQQKVQIHYTYTLNDEFQLRIWRPHGLDDLPDDLQQFPRGVAANVLWTTKLTKAQEGGKQGLVLPVRIVTELLDEDQQVLLVYVPNQGIQPWKLLWNTKIAKHCRLGQGWYRYCREKGLKAGDEICLWKVDGAQYLCFQVQRHRE
ncbi:DNA-binding barrel domain superfamily [Sesbania bispinosa]|nr:DNA-binding barrel domain superfamily [Sesbania bispinosa]